MPNSIATSRIGVALALAAVASSAAAQAPSAPDLSPNGANGVAAARPATSVQPAWPVDSGARVRLTLPGKLPALLGAGRSSRPSLTGEVVALGADTLFLRVHPAAGPAAVPRSAIEAIAVSRGVPRGRSALLGALVGAAEGTILGYAMYNADIRGPYTRSLGGSMTYWGFTGAASGAIFAAMLPGERWRRLPLTR